MMYIRAYNSYTQQYETVLLSRLKILRIWLFGSIPLSMRKYLGWTGVGLMFYVAKCGLHDHYFIDYPHGFRNKLVCDVGEIIAT